MLAKDSMNNKKIKNQRGFTLVETLVAILIFVLALSALLALVKDSVTSAIYTKNEMIATYLNQESIDYIRNIRDEIVKINPNPSSNPWNDFTYEILDASRGGCDINLVNPGCELFIGDPFAELRPCPPDGCNPIFIDDKPFRRKITASGVGDVLLIKTEIFWYNGLNQRSRVLTTSLYNWAI